MSRKNLLTESEIRKFMKLANLNESYMPEMDEDPTDLYSEAEDDAMEEPMMDEPAMDEPAMDEPAMEEPMMDEPVAPMAAEVPAGSISAEEKEEIIMGILDALQSLAGDDVEMNVNQSEEAPAAEMDDMDDMGDAEADEGGEEMADAALDDESGDDEMTEPVGDDEMIAEVARRVAARVAREQKVDDMANKLAENIFRRLASK